MPADPEACGDWSMVRVRVPAPYSPGDRADIERIRSVLAGAGRELTEKAAQVIFDAAHGYVDLGKAKRVIDEIKEQTP